MKKPSLKYKCAIWEKPGSECYILEIKNNKATVSLWGMKPEGKWTTAWPYSHTN